MQHGLVGVVHWLRCGRKGVSSLRMYRIEMLPAAHGDALWIEYGPPGAQTRIVIDGGPASTYARGLRARIERMKAEEHSHIDLFVITHIDCDHIDGAIIFLRECRRLRVTVGEIWFNGWRHLPESGEAYQPLQGEFLSALIDTNGQYRNVWNRKFRGNAIAVPADGALPQVTLRNDGRLTLLSPFGKQLARLRSQWSAAMRDFTPGDARSALARLEQRRDYRPPQVPDTFAAQTYGADRSAPNGSSIAFLLEHDGRCCLFAGDAHARVLVESLKRLTRERHMDRITLDAFKLPHHGSMGNVSPELLSLVDCRHWLISTNGAVFDHPDRATVELIAGLHGNSTIYCNYRVPSTQRLLPDRASGWSISFPGETGAAAPIGGLGLELGKKGSARAARTKRRTQRAVTRPRAARKPRTAKRKKPRVRRSGARR
jgi:hypothetical protein